MLFVHHFPRWLRENWPTQTQFPVEYGLKSYGEGRCREVVITIGGCVLKVLGLCVVSIGNHPPNSV